MSPLREALEQVRARIAAACRRAGREPGEVKLLPVTKLHPVERIVDLMALGVTDVGENRVQELRDKHAWFQARGGAQPRWHFIGSIQRNKVKYLARIGPTMLHAIDSIALARELEAQAERHSTAFDALLEINVSGETSKHGLTPGEAASTLRGIATLRHVRIRGLMTMAPFVDDPEETRPVFRAMRGLRDALQEELDCALPELSMGMSNDFEVAVEEGATIVRLGTVILGPRVRT
ncbi:YggS family pyridoxal phosphate-dependent enzyme [Candidatus Sumerlaeota bacterium]|nr:YggS family pyridoxal phosphate-dependent enzyme [Candidatus Sumerlaeota bacterium]